MKLEITAMLLIFLIVSELALGGKYYSSQLCINPNYKCVKVKRGDRWEKLFPDPKQRDLVRKLNRTNKELQPGITIAIPDNLNGDSNLMEFAPFERRIAPLDTNTILIDLSDQAFAAYDVYGILIHWGPVSSARGYCPDVNRGCHTPTGSYYIFAKGSKYCVSSKYPIPRGGAPMPFCMFFRGGFALHGSYDLPGYNASHGCIRMLYDDAEWLNKDFTNGTKTKVIVRQ